MMMIIINIYEILLSHAESYIHNIICHIGEYYSDIYVTQNQIYSAKYKLKSS